MAKNDTVKLTFQGVDDVSDVIKKINKGLEKTEKQSEKTKKKTQSLSGAVKAAGTIMGTHLVFQLNKASVELANFGAKAQMVEKNFKQFANNAGKNSDNMMLSLRKATLGMVSDMKLQQNAMKAMISGVSFDDMITAMEYVTKYAAATGDDVNVKMTTVMTGLARKSALFMDDVGIQVMGAEDVVAATIDQMKAKMGQFATSEEDAAMQAAQLAKDLQDLKANIGSSLVPVFSKLVALTRETIDGWQELGREMRIVLGIDEDVSTRMEELNKTIHDSEGRLDMLSSSLEKAYSEGEKFVTFGRDGMVVTKDVIWAQKEIDKLKEVTRLAKKEFDLISKQNIFGTKEELKPKKMYEAPEEKKKEKKEKQFLLDKFGPEPASLEASKNSITEYQAFVVAKEKETADQRKEILKEMEFFGLSNTQAEIKRVNEEFQQKKSLFQEHTDEFIALEQERIDRINELKDAEKEKAFQSAEEAIGFAADTALQINSIIEQAFSARYAKEREEIDRSTSKKREAIKESTLSEKQKNKELKKLDKEAQKAKHEIAMKDWRMNLIMSIANTALGVTKALSSSSPPLNFVMAALTGIAGAASIATIASNKPKMALGGMVPGNSFTGDQVPISVNSGEMVATQSQQRRLLDVMEGKTPGSSSKAPLSVSMGDSNIVIQGSADSNTVQEIERENLSHREKIAEMLYQLADSGELDTTRLPFAVA